MLIALQTLGTRGDVQPFVALGIGLRRAGFGVRLAADPRFRDVISGHGLDFAPLPGDVLDLIETADGRAALEGEGGLAARLRLLRATRPMLDRLVAAQCAAADGADLLVSHPKAIAGMPIAETLGIPGFLALPLPGLTPTRAFPTPMLPFSDLGPLNRASHHLVRLATTMLARGPLRRWMAGRPGLPRISGPLRLHGRPAPVLYAYSPRLVPRPADWPDSAVVTGSWVLPTPVDWAPPAELAAFLAAGPPPVYVGFGSLPSTDAPALSRLVLRALAEAGQRGVLATGGGGLAETDLPDSVHLLREAPHGWLFPRMAAVVHHGGAGSTAAGLLAGRPSVICPWFGDQPFWGRRVQALGAGPAPIPRRALTPARLAAAIHQAVCDPSMRLQTERIAMDMAEEDGIGQSVRLIRAALDPTSRNSTNIQNQ